MDYDDELDELAYMFPVRKDRKLMRRIAEWLLVKSSRKQAYG